MLRLLLLSVSLIFVFAARDARACGPSYPVEALSQRAEFLQTLSMGTFDGLVEQRLMFAKPTGGLRYKDDPKLEERAREQGGEKERTLYEKGAKAFKAKRLKEAQAYFERLLELPAGERGTRTRWAHYMLGRVHQEGEAFAKSIKHYESASTREGPDPLGLALSALGQSARLHLRANTNKQGALYALSLYRKQLSAHHPSAAASLLYLVRERKHWPDLKRTPGGRDLLAIYFATRPYEMSSSEHQNMQKNVRRRLAQGIGLSPIWAGYFYRRAQFDDAKNIAMKNLDDNIATWVRAKLAHREGDRALQETLLATLEQKLNAEGCDVESSALNTRLHQEQAILALARDDKKQAFKHLRKAQEYFGTSELYLLERLYTLNELQDLVDGLAQKKDDFCYTQDVKTRIRDILARRYFRNAQAQKALAYFSPSTQHPVKEYLELSKKADQAKHKVERAEALFELAEHLRSHGNAMMGTQHYPDFVRYSSTYGSAESEAHEAKTRSDYEKRLCAQHAPAHASQYHYREAATEIIEDAASLVHPRSQAYAAMMCRAIDMVRLKNIKRRDVLYKRYLKEGAWVDFVMGENCPAPDFKNAKHFKMPEPRRQPIRKRYIALSAAALLALTLAAIFWARTFIPRREPEL